jgi:hypothetical protein
MSDWPQYSALTERYVAEPRDDDYWMVKDRLTGRYESGHEGTEAMLDAHTYARHLNDGHRAEVNRAHEEALAYHRRLYPPPSIRYRVVCDWYATLIVDELDGRVAAEGFKGEEGLARAKELCASLNADDTRRADHERRKIRYGTCRSWRVYWERWRPVISRCSWPADHVEFTRWHCSEDTTGRVWEVAEHERKEF